MEGSRVGYGGPRPWRKCPCTHTRAQPQHKLIRAGTPDATWPCPVCITRRSASKRDREKLCPIRARSGSGFSSRVSRSRGVKKTRRNVAHAYFLIDPDARGFHFPPPWSFSSPRFVTLCVSARPTSVRGKIFSFFGIPDTYSFLATAIRYGVFGNFISGRDDGTLPPKVTPIKHTDSW